MPYVNIKSRIVKRIFWRLSIQISNKGRKFYLGDFRKKHCVSALRLPRNGQTDPPQFNRGYSEEWWFLLERNNWVSLFLYVIPLRRRCFLRTSPLNQQKLLQNEGVSIFGNVPIELFKKRNDGLENSSLSPRSKSRNGERVICWHGRG